MNTERWLAWAVFTVWLVWLHALQSLLARHGSNWIPDAALVLVFSLLARLEARDAPWLVLCALLARASMALEPAVALGAGFVLVVGAMLAARGMFELTSAAWRAFFAGAMVFAFDAWLVLVQHVRGPETPVPFAQALAALLPVAATSALISLAFGPALAHLPGLTPLRKRRW